MNNLQPFLVTHPHNHLYSFDTHHRFLSCNDMQAIDLGYTCAEEIIGKYLYDVYAKDDASAYIRNNEVIFKKNSHDTFIEITRLSERKPVIYTSYKFPQYSSKSKLVGLIGFSIGAEESHLVSLPEKLNTCFQLLIKGYDHKSISKKMSLSPKTIEHYAASIRRRLNCKSTKELIAKYARNILLDQENYQQQN